MTLNEYALTVTAGLRGSHYRKDRRGTVPGSAPGASGAELVAGDAMAFGGK